MLIEIRECIGESDDDHEEGNGRNVKFTRLLDKDDNDVEIEVHDDGDKRLYHFLMEFDDLKKIVQKLELI